MMVYGAGSLELTIEEVTGGYCILEAGVYYYDQQDAEISLFAYPYANYYFSGWIIDGTYENEANPLVIDLDNDTPITMSVSPAFSTEQHYSVYVYCDYLIYFTINNEYIQASETGTEQVYQGGTTLYVAYVDNENYDFNSFLLYGTTEITDKTFNFELEESTIINLDVTYNPTYILPPIPEDPPTFPPIIPPDSLPLDVLVSFIPSGIIIGALGVVFSEIGEKLDHHNYAGFLIGGLLGLLICTIQNLIPTWFTIFMLFVGSVAIYFWFRSGS